VYGRYDAIPSADGMLDCPNGGRLVEKECILYEESMWIPCSNLPEPTPSSSPKPILSASITIEIKTNMTFNSTATNMTVLQDPQMLSSLQEAIAKALGVPMDMVVIESIQLVQNGVLLTTVNIQGRRLSGKTGYEIQYKVVDPPTSVLQTPMEQLTARIESSTILQAVAIQTIQDMTGVALAVENIGIQSSQMTMALPTQPAQPAQPAGESKDSMYFMIGGICVAIGLVSVGAGLLIARHRKQRSAVIREGVLQKDTVTIINPMPSEQVFFPAPRYFNQSVRDMSHHRPQQVRRV
jgi:hypothetical protein